MHVIPVIDLKDGLAVAARHGRRQSYRPLSTPLCPQPEPLAVAAAYLSILPFDTLYAADLNAIEGRGDNRAAIAALAAAHPRLNLWLDAGAAHPDAPLPGKRVTRVLGSETGLSPDQARTYQRTADCILSLDFTERGFLGDPSLLERPELLPERIIVMTLGRVGSGAGPDYARLDEVMERLPGKQYYAAGGVRDAADLRRLAARGVHGALLATALHTGAVAAAQLRALQTTAAAL